MSVELYVCCYGDSLAPIADVRELLEVAGWEGRVVDSAEGLVPLEGRSLGSALVLGWEADARYAQAAEAAIVKRDSQAIDALLKKNRLAVVSVDLDESYSADPEELSALEKAEVDAKYVEAMRAARFAYNVRTSASRKECSLEFQEILWHAIGVAAYGLAHNPVDDSFEDNARELLEET